ncbi:hypothetical protein SY88_05775 [Clostridiales bacterium PH28_bin88]|nr:hypothetical protein SY88_05775 [Clostridiales bacterium PH28_bin88]
MLDFLKLRAFYKAAYHGSFSRAAEVLYVSQPALSRQVAALEQEMGLELLVRHGKGVVLTEAGRRLYEYAERIFGLLSEAAQVMGEFKSLGTGELSLGASSTIGNYILPGIIAEYLKRHPGIDVHLSVGNSEEIEKRITSRQVDLGFVAGPLSATGMYAEQFLEDELVLVAKPSHPLAQQKGIPLPALAGETFLFREPGSASRGTTERHLASHGFSPAKTFVLGDTEAIKRAVAGGMGVAFLSHTTVNIELQNEILVELDGPQLSIPRPLFTVYPKDARLSPAALAFLSLLRKSCVLPRET